MSHDSFEQKTAYDLTHEAAARVRARRKERKLTQAQMAKKAGMSFASYKRFEQTGRSPSALCATSLSPSAANRTSTSSSHTASTRQSRRSSMPSVRPQAISLGTPCSHFRRANSGSIPRRQPRRHTRPNAGWAVAFEYHDEWLAHGFSISIKSPSQKRLFVCRAAPPRRLFGVFDDSLPDGWGAC